MARKTKIEYVDATWNPVTGCFHDCKYCYARKQARRFSVGETESDMPGIHELLRPVRRTDNGQALPYPFGFEPTLHAHRLDEPAHWRRPRTIFVCDMADLLGDWVPDAWIRAVLDACRKAPQHRYLFLTKNPKRYYAMPPEPNFWYGTTATTPDSPYFYSDRHNTFLSIEPMEERFGESRIHPYIRWVVIGAETGNRRGRVIPEKEWIMEIAGQCRDAGVPVFMKESLRGTMGEDFRQELPWNE